MKVNKKEILTALKEDFRSSESHQQEWQAQREEWRSQSVGEEYGNEVDGKSRIVSKDIAKQISWMLPSLADPFLSSPDIVKTNPVTEEDLPGATQSELLLNTFFCRKFPRHNFIMKALKVLLTEGTVVVKTGWDYEDDEIDIQAESVAVDEYGREFIEVIDTTKIKILKNEPTAEVCRNEDIFIDPTCMDELDKCQFVIHRYETDMSTLRKDGRYKNLDKLGDQVGDTTTDADGYLSQDQTGFKFNDEPRRKLLAYEYWGYYDVDGDGEVEPIVCTWVNNTIIRLQTNPYPDNKPPFVIVPFNSIPFQMFGEALAEIIGDNQKVKTAITRGIIDNMAKSNNGQIGFARGALDDNNRRKFLKGDNFEYNGNMSQFWQGSYNQIPGSAFDMLGMQNNEIEAQTGVKSFSGGITGSALGNMLDIATDIPLIDGSWKKLEQIKDGDVLIGSDGRGTTVLKAHEIKYPKQAYDMVFGDNVVVKSGGEHLWTIKVKGTSHKLREWHTVDADTIYAHMQIGRTVIIPKIQEIHTGTPISSTIDPYVFGFWLGDGMSHSARITCADYEVVEHFSNAGYVCVAVKDSSKTGNATMYDVYKKGFEPSRNVVTGQYESSGSFHSELKELGVHARYGGEKHIPEMFMNATYEEKMELIRGLMDSDGFAHSGAFVQFAQAEGILQKDFIKLLSTLGLKVSVRIKDMDTTNKYRLLQSERTGTKMIWARKDSYEIGFTPWSNPFKLSRKANKWKSPKSKTVKLTSMKIVDKVLMRCLTVDSEDKLFAVTDKYILTHNTATGARGALDATSVRRTALVRNIAENMIKPLMRKWLAYFGEFMEPEEVIRITNTQFAPIRRDDLAGNLDIEITISTAEDNSARAEQYSFLLQTLGNNMPFEITQKVLAKIAKLARDPEMEKDIKEFKKEPDPAAEQMKQIQLERAQLENDKLRAEIERDKARASEDRIDAQVKMAKMESEKARARKLNSDADMVDLNYVDKDHGFSSIHSANEKEKDRQHQAALAAMQIRAGDNNVGIARS